MKNLIRILNLVVVGMGVVSLGVCWLAAFAVALTYNPLDALEMAEHAGKKAGKQIYGE